MTTPPDSTQQSEATPSVVCDSWSRTRMVVTKLCHRWTVDDFGLRREDTGEKISSPTFTAAADAKTKWCLEVYPNGQDEESKNFVSLFLTLAEREEDEFGAKVELSLLNAKGQETKNDYFSRCYSKTDAGNCTGYPKFIKRDVLLKAENKLLLDGKFRILCKVSTFTRSVNTSGNNRTTPAKLPKCQLSQDLGQLLKDGKFSDVVFSVDGREIHAHKGILAARSVVFAAMFEHDMEEKKQNRVEITDLDYDVVFKMVQFIYSGSVGGIDELAEGLLAAADKYALERLKAMCEKSLCSELTVGRAVDLLMLAEKHSADQLKATVIDFISTRAHDVMNTTGWKTLSEQWPHLIVEAFHQLVITLASGKPCS